jgi:hypothetical protein
MDLSVLRDHVIFRPLKLQFVSDFWMQFFFFYIALQIFPKTLFFFPTDLVEDFTDPSIFDVNMQGKIRIHVDLVSVFALSFDLRSF